MSADAHRSGPAQMYGFHEREFARVKPWLRDYYAGYTNRDKLVALLDSWLFAHRCFLNTYGVEATRAFARRGGSHMRYAWLVEFGVDVTFDRPPPGGQAWAGLAAGLLPIAYLPGGRVRSLFSKFAWRVSRLVAMAIPTRVREERKHALVQQLVTCIPEHERTTMQECLSAALPGVFAAGQVATAHKAELPVDCSASSLMDFCGYENLLLLDRRLRVIGRQHGGGYDIFRNDPWVRLEQALCDRFVGWGHSAINERQHKYPRRLSSAGQPKGERRVVIVERPSFARILEMLSPPIYSQYRNTRAIEFVGAEVQSFERPYFSLPYPGSMRCPDYDGLRGTELWSKRGGEMTIRLGDVVIFDTSAGSLIHYCIEQGITFVIVVSRTSVVEFTQMHAEWMSVLRAAGLAFYDDETTALARSLEELTAEAYEIPAAVAEFHRRHFIDIE